MIKELHSWLLMIMHRFRRCK